MTDGGADRRSQLIMWAMAEMTRLRRQPKRAGGRAPRSASAGRRGRSGDRGGLVVDWQMPAPTEREGTASSRGPGRGELGTGDPVRGLNSASG